MTELLICLHFFAAVGELMEFMPLFITALVAARTDGSGPAIHQVLRSLRLSRMTTANWLWAGFNMCFSWRPVATPITRITFMVQQRYIVNQRLQLRLQVDYETGPSGGIYIRQRVFPQQRIKELGLDLRYGAQTMGYYQMHPFISRSAGFTRQI